MKLNQQLTLFIILLSFYTVTPQMSAVKEANKKFKKFAYVDAREIYLQVANDGYRSADLLKKLGDSYYFDGDMKNAVEWYAELVTKYSDYSPDYLFRYAQSLKSLKLYKASYDIMRTYYYKKGVDPASMLKKRNDDYMDMIEIQSGRYALLPFKYNSTKSDLSPQFTNNGSLIFSSDRNTASSKTKSNKDQTSLNIYTVSGTKTKQMTGAINTKFDESSLIYSKDGKTVYFSRSTKISNNKSKNPAKTTSSKLYKATILKGQLKNIKKLPFNSHKYSISHPALSPDGKKLYFASDMPGSLGQSDIFVVEIKENNRYGTPKNLGKNVNTLGNESFPYIAENGNLYFASDTHFGLGGFDLFVSKYYHQQYQEPSNLGRPINSMYDDVSFIINDKTKLGYLASNRSMDNDQDIHFNIYKFEQQKKPILNCGQSIQGKIIDAKTKKGISSCVIKLLDDHFKEIASTQSDKNGYYDFKLYCSTVYLIRVHKPSYCNTEKVLYAGATHEKEISLPIQLNKGSGLQKTWVFAGDKLNDILELSAIHFDSNTAKIRPDAEIEIQKVIAILKKMPQLKIKINSYTDNTGKYYLNKKLSKNRSIATKKYIVKKGKIDPSRISTEGYGQSDPVVNCGKNCSETENQTNRRSEFILMR